MRFGNLQERSFIRIHEIMPATAVYMNINETRRNKFTTGIDLSGICCDEIAFAHGRDPAIGNQYTTRRYDTVWRNDLAIVNLKRPL